MATGRGIIPALAGNTGGQQPLSPEVRDHPRSRGEYCFSRGLILLVVGSSPLSRGIRKQRPRTVVRGRIIPALAGNTTVKVLCISLS